MAYAIIATHTYYGPGSTVAVATAPCGCMHFATRSAAEEARTALRAWSAGRYVPAADETGPPTYEVREIASLPACLRDQFPAALAA